MSFTAPLNERRRQPEVMDQPDLDEQRHRQALRGLERINWWSGSARVVWPPIRDLARELGRPLRVLDVATGAGDVPVRLWHKARRAGLPIAVDGCDLSPRAVAFARERARERGAEVHFFELNALGGEIPPGYDVLISSLFLHHLDEHEAIGLLRRLGAAAGQAVLINDLRRSAAGLALAYLATRLLTTCDVVHDDGARSVEAAFTVPEVRDLARRAGLDGARVARRWPYRFLLSWRKPR